MHGNLNSAIATYNQELEERVAAWARAKIAPNRLGHVEGVVETCETLARRYAPDDVARARLAGWIHDAAKHWPDDDLLAYAEANHLPITEGDRAVPMLLHGIVAYALAADIFELNDPELAAACNHHTTGAPGMGTLEKIVFLADLIEPGRDFPGVEALREAAERDLDTAVLMAVDHTLRYLIDRQRVIDPRALLLRNELLLNGVRY
ncbi:MAG: bis(5'-nucleosyl)-tetraphosphatase (symmetrical) YqeK [Chloroflexota bacterium]